MMRTKATAALLPLLPLLYSCAAPGPVPGSQPAAVTAPVESKREDILYSLLVAELAGQRGRYQEAIDNLLKVARQVDNPHIAERAMRAAEYAKDHKSALAAAERWVELAPGNAEAHLSLAMLAVREGRTDRAREVFRRTLELESVDAEESFMIMAGWLGRTGENERGDALEVMAALVEPYPDNPWAHLAYGNLALVFGEYETAEAALSRALELKPGFSKAVMARGRVLRQLGRVDEALAELRQTVEAAPEDEPLRLSYARLLLEAKRYPEAKRQFSVLSEASPHDSDLIYTLALLALDMEQYGQAKGYLERLLELGERNAEARYYLGKLAETRRDYRDAISHYSQVQQSRYALDAQVRIAQLHGLLGEVERGRERLRQLRERNPESSVSVRLYIAEAALLNEAGNYRGAVEMLSQGLEGVPGNTDLLYMRALTYEKLDRLDLLENDLRAVLLREPENAAALNALGYTLADRTTRYEEAYTLIRQALKLSPDDPAIIDSMGWVLYRMGRVEEAIAYLRRALGLQYDTEIAAHLGEALWRVGEREAARALLDKALEEAPDDEHLLEVKEQWENNQP